MALTLTRKLGESVRLELPDGNTVHVHVSAVRAGQVQLTFDAPADVRIWREELAQRMEEEASGER